MGYQFASEAAAAAAQEKGYSIEQLSPGSGSGGNVTKSDVDGYEGDPALTPGAPAAQAGPPVTGANEAPGTGTPGPLDMELGGDAPVDPPGADPSGVDEDGKAAGLAMRERDHAENCPGRVDEDGKDVAVETYFVTKPPVKDPDGMVLEPARRVEVARCVECGGQRIGD